MDYVVFMDFQTVNSVIITALQILNSGTGKIKSCGRKIARRTHILLSVIEIRKEKRS